MKMIKNNSAVKADTTSDLWEKMNKLTVGECFFQIRNGANIKQGVADGGFPITRIETIANDRFNRDRMGYAGITDADKYQSYILEDGDLLMSHINSVQYLGRTVLYHKQENEKIIHGMNLLAMKANRDILNPAYAQYYFRSIPFREQIRQITKKSVNQASFTVSDLKKIPMQVPSLLEQCNAVETLDRVNKLLELHQHQLQKLDELIKARFVEMFGDPVGNTKAYYVATLQELICKGYITYHLDGNHGSDYPKSDEFVEAGTPYISANCIVNGEVDFSKAKYLTLERANKLRKGIAQNEDVLFAHNATVGPTVVLHTTKEKVILGTSLTAYRCNKEKILPSYLKSYMLSDGFIRQYSNEMKQTTRNQVPITAQKKYLFLIPPIGLQNQFATFVNQVDKSKVAVQKSLDEAQLLFDSLMQQYFE